MRINIILLALAAVLSSWDFAVAGEREVRQSTTHPRWLGKAEVELRVAELGYSVRKIKSGVGRYEVKATAKDGRDVELFVDPWTGAIVNPGQ
jgi:hypothetical protein